ncbi:MAG: bifunctional riboflavin kinase/FAD synthetase [Nitrosomonas sp.]|nr:bifunctional riboflavin kinase/FAD synthetase [Nitrosomonas sp.]MBK7364143.1 bifunctional riboflavin kinase/FAD synthetase [Nitrosomonas sp.]
MHVFHSITTQHKIPLALTIGNFDGVHLGHQAMLERLKRAAKRLNIASCIMIFEPHPREFLMPNQSPARLTSLREKLEIFAQLGIDRVQICHFNHAFAQISAQTFITDILIQQLNVQWMLVGDDFRFGTKRSGDVAMLEAYAQQTGQFNVEVMADFSINHIRVSSTAIREALSMGDMVLAQQLLGRPFSMSGRIVNGDKLAKKLGFPTANIHFKHNHPPLRGIFVVEVISRATSNLPKVMKGVASLGVRPTTHTSDKLILEVHLFDFDQEIYGHHLQVNFLHKLRDEQKYTDLEKLIEQIKQDITNAKQYFMLH